MIDKRSLPSFTLRENQHFERRSVVDQLGVVDKGRLQTGEEDMVKCGHVRTGDEVLDLVLYLIPYHLPFWSASWYFFISPVCFADALWVMPKYKLANL